MPRRVEPEPDNQADELLEEAKARLRGLSGEEYEKELARVLDEGADFALLDAFYKGKPNEKLSAARLYWQKKGLLRGMQFNFQQNMLGGLPTEIVKALMAVIDDKPGLTKHDGGASKELAARNTGSDATVSPDAGKAVIDGEWRYCGVGEGSEDTDSKGHSNP